MTNYKFKKRLNQKVEKLEVPDCPLPVYRSEEIDTPGLIGICRASIYVTGEVAENPVLLRHVIYHELTHYRHHDQIWAVVRCICLIVHWYNPLVWYAAILSKQDAEFACDEGTILKLLPGEWKEYGRTLIQLTCKKKSEILVVTSTMASAKKYINERVALIAKMQGRKQRIWVYAVTALFIFLITGVTFTEAKEVYDSKQVCIGQYLKEVDWQKVQSDMSEAEANVLEKYRTVLNGGKVVWVDTTLSGEFSIQEYMDRKMKRMNLEERELIIESFLFSDVFQSGETDVAVLVRHVSKSWVILHEEAGTVYAVEMSHIAFKGIQENGLYYGAGGQGIQYYEKMTLNDAECEKTQMCVRLNGKMVYPQYKNEAEAREKVETGREVPIYTLVEKR